MKQMQPFQKYWLQITSIVICRLKANIHREWTICSNTANYTVSDSFIVSHRQLYNIIVVLVANKFYWEGKFLLHVSNNSAIHQLDMYNIHLLTWNIVE